MLIFKPLGFIVAIFIFLFFSCSCANHMQKNAESTVDDHQVKVSGITKTKSQSYLVEDQACTALVLSIPMAKASDFLSNYNHTLDEDLTPYSLSPFSEPMLQEYVEAYTKSNLKGAYEMKIPPGDYLFCLGRLNLATNAIEFPTYLVGCIKVNVPDKGTALNLYYGSGTY